MIFNLQQLHPDKAISRNTYFADTYSNISIKHPVLLNDMV